jgi:ABC-type glycerol-3-phosphate transport system permease component
MDATNWPLLMAGAVVMMVPVLIVLFLGQRALWPAADRAHRAPKLGAA